MRMRFRIAMVLVLAAALFAVPLTGAPFWTILGGLWLTCLIAVLGIFDHEARETAAQSRAG